MRNILLSLIFLFHQPITALATNYCEHANAKICWTLEEGSGTTTDDKSSAGRDGTFKGDGEPAWSTTNPPTAYTTFVDYDDSNDYISTPDSADLDFISNSEDFTLYLVFDQSDADAFNRWVTKQDGTSGDGWAIARNNDCITFIREVSGTQTIANRFNDLSSGTWHVVFFQWDASEGKIRHYLDKSASSWVAPVTNGTYGWASDGKLYLGGRDNVASSTGTKFAAFAIWNSLLETTEMDDISDNGLGAGGSTPATRRVMVIDE